MSKAPLPKESCLIVKGTGLLSSTHPYFHVIIRLMCLVQDLLPRGCPDARGECGAVIVRCINYMRNIKWILPFRKTEQKGLSVILHRWGTLSLKSVRFLARTDRWKGTTDLLSSPTCPPSKRERCQRLARRSGSTIPGLDSRTGKSPVRQEMTSSHGKHASSRTIGKC